MALSPVKILLFLAGGSAAIGGTAYVAGVFDPYLNPPPRAAAVTPEAQKLAALPPAEAPAELQTRPGVETPQPSAVETPQQPKTETPAPQPSIQAPAFDVVRVEADGSIVIAGHAAPNAKVEAIIGSRVIGTAICGSGGDFAIVLDEPLKPGDYQIVLRSTTPDNVVAMSTETAVVSIPDKPDGQVLALVEEPGKPAELITVPEPDKKPAATVSPEPEKQPEAQDRAAEKPAAPADKPAGQQDIASTEPQLDEPAAEQPAAGQPAAAQDKPAATQEQSASAGEKPAEKDVASVQQQPAAEQSAAPAEKPEASADKPAASQEKPTEQDVAATQQQPTPEQPGVEQPAAEADEPAVPEDKPAASQELAAVTPAPEKSVVQPPPPGEPRVIVEAVEIDGRTIFVAGSADPGRTLRGYANEILLGDARTSPGGRFLIEAERDLPVGDYIIRVDALGPDGVKVLARAAVPFEREAGDNVAAVASAEPEQEPSAPAEKQSRVTRQPAATDTQPRAAASGQDEGPAAEPPAGPSTADTAQPPVVAEDKTEPSPEIAAAPAPDKPAAVADVPVEAKPAEQPEADAPANVAAAPVEQPAQSAETPAAPADLAAARPQTTAPKLQSVDSAVIIRRGDTLWRISRRVYGRGMRYSTIYLANQEQIRDPDMIWPGQVFNVPHKTEKGEMADMSRMGEQAVPPVARE